MKSLSLWRVSLSVLFTILSVVYLLPNFEFGKGVSWLPSSKINLGLDLQGGSHILLDVEFDSYIKDQLEVVSSEVRKGLISNKIGYKNLHSGDTQITFNLRNEEDFQEARSVIKKTDRGLNVDYTNGVVSISFSDDKLASLKEKVLDQSIEIVRLRVDPNGTTEPILQRQGDSHILLQVPGAEDPSHLKSVLGQTAKLTFHLVDENASIEQAERGHVPAGTLYVTGEGERGVVIKKKASLTGDTLVDAQATFNNQSQPAVSFSFNSVGSKIFAEITRQNTGKRFAIVLDNKLLSAPVINQPITGGSGI
ncbi:MAG: protein translocase subunit SecD, partial [Rickettsiaceae bacterium]|nr:protein translocase subunit SecD [Rickettsiaceae bacterium]